MEVIMQIMCVIFDVLILLFMYFSVLVVLMSFPTFGANIFFLIKMPETKKEGYLSVLSGMVSFLSNAALTGVILLFHCEDGFVEWYQPMMQGVHTPVSLPYCGTFIVMILTGVIGYLIIGFFEMEKIPPLLFITAVSMIYIGGIFSIIWSIQTCSRNILLSLCSLNYIIASAGLIRRKVIEFSSCRRSELNKDEKSFTVKMKIFLRSACSLPLYSVIMILPVISFIIGILMLLGQDHDSIIKMWTQTSDWQLSEMGESPKNIIAVWEGSYSDGHYLCTVAAGGHRKIVKPQRMGRRHGHDIVVNRQLCVANAFEQILQEKNPVFHKAVRSFYDKYGLPVSKLIRKPLTADIVYIIMKPLEWLFLIVLYMTDAEPEKRIAVQYLPEKDKMELQKFFDEREKA